MTNPANTSGPAGDGSKSLAKESKVGVVLTVVLSIIGSGLVTWLSNLDTTQWTGWWVSGVVTIIGGIVGLISAWLKSNR
jgi:uncharacterized membrane protein YeaQ/YmgE (transglycosylase-associated protein family)